MVRSVLFILMFYCLLFVCCGTKDKPALPLNVARSVMLGDTSHKIYYPAKQLFDEKPFPGSAIKKEDTLLSAYRLLMKRLGHYARKSGLQTGDTLKGWWNVYFDKSGKIDAMTLSVYNQDFSDTLVQKIFDNAGHFVDKEKIALSSIYNFHQCGPIAIVVQ